MGGAYAGSVARAEAGVDRPGNRQRSKEGLMFHHDLPYVPRVRAEHGGACNEDVMHDVRGSGR